MSSGLRRAVRSLGARLVSSARQRWSTARIARCRHHVFASLGGSGSAHLLSMLFRTGRAFRRPDTAWTPPILGDPAWELLDLSRGQQ